jgi:hypothetical protein
MKTVGKDIKYKFCHVGRTSFSPDDDDGDNGDGGGGDGDDDGDDDN